MVERYLNIGYLTHGRIVKQLAIVREYLTRKIIFFYYYRERFCPTMI